MRIEKWGFLLSYAIYLVFCIFFSLISKDAAAINSMIFAITIASTSFAISDLLFTKFDIDQKERESLFGLYYLSNQAKNICLNQINAEYGQKAEEIVSGLMRLFKGDEDIIMKYFEGNLSSQEKDGFLAKVRACSNDELTEFVISLMESDSSDIKEVLSDDESEKREIFELLHKQERKEAINHRIASSVAVFGLVALLLILTTRIGVMPYVNNALTVIAFLSAIVNLLLREYYKANSLKTIEQQKEKLLETFKKNKNI